MPMRERVMWYFEELWKLVVFGILMVTFIFVVAFGFRESGENLDTQSQPNAQPKHSYAPSTPTSKVRQLER